MEIIKIENPLQRHIILYAMGRYEKKDCMKDLKTIAWEISLGGDESTPIDKVNEGAICSAVADAFMQIAKPTDLQHCLREIFGCGETFFHKEPNSITTKELVSYLLTSIERKMWTLKQGRHIDLGKPDYTILPKPKRKNVESQLYKEDKQMNEINGIKDNPEPQPTAQEIVDYLIKNLDKKMTAYLCGFSAIDKLTDIDNFQPIVNYRLQSAYPAIKLLIETCNRQWAISWLFGMNRFFDDRAPIDIIRYAESENDLDDILASAKCFVNE